MRIYGITGQTGGGKSTVLQVIEKLGGQVIDCDRLYWETLEEDSELQQTLCDNFPGITDKDGVIDRKLLGNAVFGHEENLQRLNQLTHPILLKKIEKIKENAEKTGGTLLGIDAIALIESGLNQYCHQVIAVVAEESLRIARIQKRDGISLEYAKKRVRSQKQQEYYVKHADILIENQGDDPRLLLQTVEQIINQDMR